MIRLALRAVGLLACSALLSPSVAMAEPVGVSVRNQSVAATCAETDNVTLAFVSEKVTKFRITARHPAYAGMLLVDRTEPDFDTCDFSADPVVPATTEAAAPAADPRPEAKPEAKADAKPDAKADTKPAAKAAAPASTRRVTLFETPDMWLVGYTFPSFWQPANVPVRVGGASTAGLHMLQLWVRQDGKPEEVLVVYPPDGYWRARPLAPAHLASTAYGSSFLVGPVEQAERPLVRLKGVDFAPQTRSFSIYFADGGKARLQVARLDRDGISLDVEFDGPTPSPFAALRSMYVTEGNADVARVAWRTLAKGGTNGGGTNGGGTNGGGTNGGGTNGGGMGEAPVLTFDDAENVSWLWAGRLVPSRHNTSAPDLVFDGFATR